MQLGVNKEITLFATKPLLESKRMPQQCRKYTSQARKNCLKMHDFFAYLGKFKAFYRKFIPLNAKKHFNKNHYIELTVPIMQNL
jgi:hypothetical protein